MTPDARAGSPSASTLLLVVVLVGASADGLLAQSVTGRVVDATTGEGIPTAAVEILDGEGVPMAAAATDGSGLFRIQLPAPGEGLRLDARAFTYRASSLDSLTVRPGEVLALPDLALDPVPVLLDPIDVETGRGWVSRGREWVRQGQLSGQGTFFAGAVIGLDEPASLTQYIAEHAGLTVVYSFSREPYLRSLDASNPCVRVQLNRWPIAGTQYISLDRIPLDIIAAIEVYNTWREVPSALAWDADRCGLVNVWTWASY